MADKPVPSSSASSTKSTAESGLDVSDQAVDEYEAQQSPEALGAKDADKLEMLLHAVEYRDVGVSRVDGWIDSARRGVKTETARRIAEAALMISPLAWRER